MDAKLSFLLLIASVSVGVSQKTDQECNAPFQSMLTCLDYVEGKVKFPPQDCCDNLQKVLSSHPKCLCELVQASHGTPIPGVPPLQPDSVMKLPKVCKAPADQSRCPGLLGISASSPEAQIFKTNSSSTVPGGPKAAGSTTASTDNSKGEKAKSDSSIGSSTRTRDAMFVMVGAVFVLAAAYV